MSVEVCDSANGLGQVRKPMALSSKFDLDENWRLDVLHEIENDNS